MTSNSIAHFIWGINSIFIFIFFSNSDKIIQQLSFLRWILTAAHCLSRTDPLIAHYGQNEIGSYSDEVQIPTSQQHIHPKFMWIGPFPVYDMGLVELTTKLMPDASAKPINISNKCDTHLDNVDAIAVGKGKTSFAFSLSDLVEELRKLRHIYVSTIPSNDCDEYLKKFNETFHVMCSEPWKRSHLLHGDSGEFG